MKSQLTKLFVGTKFINHINFDKIDKDKPYQSIFEMIDDANVLKPKEKTAVESMKFLTEHDVTLKKSIDILNQWGFTSDHYNSEDLALALEWEMNNKEFETKYRNQIENIFK